jgi:hypothetical protein
METVIFSLVPKQDLNPLCSEIKKYFAVLNTVGHTLSPFV